MKRQAKYQSRPGSTTSTIGNDEARYHLAATQNQKVPQENASSTAKAS